MSDDLFLADKIRAMAPAIDGFAPLVNRHILGFTEALDALIHAGLSAPPFLQDDVPLQTHICNALAQACEDRELSAASAIRAAIAPFIASRAPSRSILVAAHIANRSRRASDVAAIVREEIGAALRQRRG